MLPLDVHLHPSEAAISHAVVNSCIWSVGAAEGMMSAGVKEVTALAKSVKEERPEYSHAQHCPKNGILRRPDVSDVAHLGIEGKRGVLFFSSFKPAFV